MGGWCRGCGARPVGRHRDDAGHHQEAGDDVGGAHRLAQVLPLTHVVAVSRALVRGQPSWHTVGHAAVVLGCAAAAMALAARLLRRRLQI